MVPVNIRRLQKNDAAAVSCLVGRNFLEVNIKDYPEDTISQLVKSYNTEKILRIANSAHSYVACIGPKIIGCGSIASFLGKENESILLAIFVLPEYHGKGIGREIMTTLENDAYFLRARRIEIASSITACEFYRKLGYDYKDGLNTIDDEGLYRLEKFR
jgi:GNAT superfamily N-acetyltransferase